MSLFLRVSEAYQSVSGLSAQARPQDRLFIQAIAQVLAKLQGELGESTGAGAAALGANCPAITLAAPYKWLKLQSDDGSIIYVPGWK